MAERSRAPRRGAADTAGVLVGAAAAFALVSGLVGAVLPSVGESPLRLNAVADALPSAVSAPRPFVGPVALPGAVTAPAAAPAGSAFAATSGRVVTTTAPADGRAAIAIAFALRQIGLPYVWGGNGPARGDAGFDCSGLTTAAYAAAGIRLPRTAHTQFHAGPHVPLGASLLPGDLVFYGTVARVHHVGLYLGEGRMVAAPTFGKPVRISSYRWPGDDYLGATRPAAAPGSLGVGLLPDVAAPAPAVPPAVGGVFAAPPASPPTVDPLVALAAAQAAAPAAPVPTTPAPTPTTATPTPAPAATPTPTPTPAAPTTAPGTSTPAPSSPAPVPTGTSSAAPPPPTAETTTETTTGTTTPTATSTAPPAPASTTPPTTAAASTTVAQPTAQTAATASGTPDATTQASATTTIAP